MVSGLLWVVLDFRGCSRFGSFGFRKFMVFLSFVQFFFKVDQRFGMCLGINWLFVFTNPIETLIFVTLGVERIENVDGHFRDDILMVSAYMLNCFVWRTPHAADLCSPQRAHPSS